MKHNPGFMAADELVAAFVARETELATLRRIVADNLGPSNQHALVIGRRGLGKTMLVHRLAIEIREDPELSARWYPLVFGEESYNVATAGELWLEALLQLGEQTKDPRWLRTHDHLIDERDDQRLREAALARLLDFADEQGKRLLLIVENLQELLGDQMSDDEGWVLRHTLLNEPRLMLLATATNRFDEIDQPRQAAYELFRVIELEPLDGEDCRRLWQTLTGELLPGRAIRPVEIFTGGNLRLLVILAQFAAGRTFHAFARDLLALIDDHSDYFKGNLEALPLDERRVFTALCDRWAPSLAREVARGARFDVNKTSMLLGRLVRRGAVEVVGIEGRSKRYQVVERLYNLFYLLRRRGAREARLRGLVEFMVRFYAGARLELAARWIAEEAVGLEARLRRDNVVALSALIERLRAQGQVEGVLAQLPTEFWYLPEVAGREELKDERRDVRERAFLQGLVDGMRGVRGIRGNPDRGFGWALGGLRCGSSTTAEVLAAMAAVEGFGYRGIEVTLGMLRLHGDAELQDEALARMFECSWGDEPTFGRAHILVSALCSGLIRAVSSCAARFLDEDSSDINWHKLGSHEFMALVESMQMRTSVASRAIVAKQIARVDRALADELFAEAWAEDPEDLTVIELMSGFLAADPDQRPRAEAMVRSWYERTASPESLLLLIDLELAGGHDLEPLLLNHDWSAPILSLFYYQLLAHYARHVRDVQRVTTMCLTALEGSFDEALPLLLLEPVVIALLRRDPPAIDLAATLDAKIRAKHPKRLPAAHHLTLAYHQRGPAAALELLPQLLDANPAACGETPRAAPLGLSAEGGVAETSSTPGTGAFRLPALDENPGARRCDGFHHRLLATLPTEPVLLDLAATYPAQLRELLAGHPRFEPILVALDLDLDLDLGGGAGVEAPLELLEVARDVLAEIRARRIDLTREDVGTLRAAEGEAADD